MEFSTEEGASVFLIVLLLSGLGNASGQKLIADRNPPLNSEKYWFRIKKEELSHCLPLVTTFSGNWQGKINLKE